MPLATGLPSLWEDGAFDRLIARLASLATHKTRPTGIAIQGQGARKQGIGRLPGLAFFVRRPKFRRPPFRLPPNPSSLPR